MTGGFRVMRLLGLLCAFGVVVSCVEAAPRFAHAFGDHAVLQRDAPVRVWGSGAGSSGKLEIRFGRLEVAVSVDSDGNWNAALPAMSGSRIGQKLELLEDGTPVAVVNDVVVGEVWLAAGQSNMQFPVRGMLKGVPEAKAWVDEAERPAIRFRRVNDPVLADRKAEARDLKAREAWARMTPKSALVFSAVAAVFARELEAELDVPIGIIDVSWGGKPIEPFIPRDRFTTPLLREIVRLADADKLDELAKLEGGLIIRNPQGHPGAIYNARMAPWENYGLRGFLWYQAESNAGKGEDPRHYADKMKAMAEGWRKRWGDKLSPLYFVQLPGFPGATGWIRMREEQRLAATIPNSAMAVTIDIRGEGIHPPDKISVGRRLAALALEKTYRNGVSNSEGPMYRSHEIRGGVVRVLFDPVGGGLMVGDKPGVAPAEEIPGAPLRWFELAGEDGVWHPARAEIRGGAVWVSSDAVVKPVAVRYACGTEPRGGNLYNREGFPVSPFCSDLKLLPWKDHGGSR